MSRTLRRSTTLPSWEADRQAIQARKQLKQTRKAFVQKRDAQDAIHKPDAYDMHVERQEQLQYDLAE